MRPLSLGRLVTLSSVVVASPFFLMGPGWLLDDWWTLRNAELDAWWNAAGEDQWWVRPGAAAVYALFFGVLQRPAVVYLVLVVLNGLLALRIFHLAATALPQRAAMAVALTWVVLPNHTTMDYWASAGNITVALILAVTGAIHVGRDRRQDHVVAGLLFGAAALFYEATLALSGVAAVAIPLLKRHRRPWITAGTGLAGCVLAAAWIVLHWHPQKEVAAVQDMSPLFDAHFGWGVLPEPAASVAAVAVFAFLVYSVLASAATRFELELVRFRVSGPEQLALIGLTLIVAGVLPFLRYGYQPLGLGDRANVVSSVGAAMVWAAALWRTWVWRSVLGAALGLALGLLMLFVRYDRALTYARAGEDAAVVLDVLAERFPEAGTEVVVGPTPLICDNIVGFFDEENIGPAYQLRMGSRDYWAVVSHDEKAYQSEDGRPRLDQHLLRPESAACR